MFEHDTVNREYFCDAIEDGDADSFLDDLAIAVADRQSIIKMRKNGSIRTGDTVRFNNKARPKYLQGLDATVKKLNRKTVVVDFPYDPSYGRFSNARNVRAPFTIVDKV